MSNLNEKNSPSRDRELGISIAMCTFNGEKYLLKQLNSIADQTTLPGELIICDDGSTDHTLQLARDFAVRAPFPVRIISNRERLGSTKNFEKAIQLCKGQIIALCDQDDIWYPEKLETFLSMFHSDADLGGVFSDGDLIGANDVALGMTLWQSFLFNRQDQDAIGRGLAKTVMFRRTIVTGATLAFRSSLREKLLPIPTSWVHDGWLAWMLYLNSKLGLCPKSLIRYRIHPSQQIGAPTSKVSFLGSMAQEGGSQYFARMRLKHIAEYKNTSQQFTDLHSYLQTSGYTSDDSLSRLSEVKAEFSASVAYAMSLPRRARFHRILREAANYFRYSARPVRLLIRDMIL